MLQSKMSLYLTLLAKWSDYCHVAVTPGNRIIGYILGATVEQAQGERWQGLVQAVNVASGYRRQKFATRLMQTLEKQLVEKMRVSIWCQRYFVCLYVGVNKTPATEMFEQLGYETIKVMPNFLPNNENAYKMRKELVEEDNYISKMKKEKEFPADWSELDRDLLGLVVRRLSCDDDFDDYVRIGAVCRSWRLVGDVYQSWRSIATDNRCPLNQFPVLMVPGICQISETRRLLRLNRESSYFEQGNNYDQLQVPHGHICRGSAYGWLFLTDDNLDVRLLNPFSGSEIQLPSVTTLPVSSGSNDMPAWVHKAIYSSNPSFQPLPVIFILYGGLYPQLAFCKPGDEEWTTLQSPLDQNDYYRDAIYYKDQFYALSFHGCIVAAFDIGSGIDVGEDHHPVLKAVHIAAKPSMGDLYLVEVDGELVKLERDIKIEVYDDSDDATLATLATSGFQTMGFKIQKFEASEEKWVDVKDLGDNALFLGYNASFSFTASKFPGCVPNSVYFTNSGGNEDAGHDMGIYYLTDETIKPLYSMDDYDQLTNPSPVWVTHFDCSCSHTE